MNTGIYKILNIINNKCYIGSAVDITMRWYCHKNHLKRNIHYNYHLQKAWNLYGEKSFSFEIIELCEKEKLLKKEQEYIDKYNSTNIKLGYNINPIAGSNLGRKWSEKTRNLMGKSRTGSRNPSKRPEVREKISKSNKGKVRSKEVNLHLSTYMINYHKNHENHFKNKKHTKETKNKISEAIKGRIPWNKGEKLSMESRRKMSESRKGRIITEDHCQKISNTMKGRIFTKEHKKKLSEAAKRRWSNS